MENYFNYFTEVEDHFQKRRGTTLLLSTLDWALIETWKDAGIPLEAVLAGIDATFDAHERRAARARTRRVNGLAFCSQEVLAAAEQMKEAATGATPQARGSAVAIPVDDAAAYFRRNAATLRNAALPAAARPVAQQSAEALLEMAQQVASQPGPDWEGVERRLTVLEEKLFAALLASTPEAELLSVRSEADRDIAPYRSKMSGPQIEQLHRQYVNKRLLERARLPRLSLFYL